MSVLKRGFPVPPGQYPPFAVVTDTDHTAWIVIVTALGMTCTLVFGVMRVFVRRMINPPFGLDDIILAAATVVAFVQSSTILGACSKGLGKSITLVPLDDQIEVQEMYYASNLLFLIAMGLSKISIIAILFRLSPDKRHQLVFGIATGVIVAWTIASVVAVALQCNLSRPWQSLGEDCSGTLLRWQTICVIDMLTEVGLVGLAIYLVWSLQTSTKNKFRVISVFSFRLLILIAIGFRLATFSDAGFTTNPTLSEDYFIVWTQTEMSYALMSTTMPILQPFMRNLNTMHGGLGVEGNTSAYDSNSGSRTRYVSNYALSKLGSKLNSSHARSTVNEDDEEAIIRSGSVDRIGLAEKQVSGKNSRVGATGEASAGRNLKADAISIDSTESRQMMIRKDVTWRVEHESP